MDSGVHVNAEGKLPIDTGKRNRMRSCVLFIAAVLFTACDPESGAEKSGQRFIVADIILTIVNHSETSAQISVESDMLEHPLGDVVSGAARSFSLPSAMIGSSSLLRLKAADGQAVPVRSDAFQVQRGQKVEWTLADTGRGTLVQR